ncbi:MAG TPA: pyruvate dehydrogenase (acetyl-transferring) E1 component subunit alpha [Pseudonocardiaceae bacterium]
MHTPTPIASSALLPTDTPLGLLNPDGSPVADPALTMPTDDVLLRLYRGMVLGRRFDQQATALTKQGRLAVYPSAHGQEASEIGAVAALREQDWLFPTYRDSVAIVSRGVDPVEVLSLLRGDWHCGYDPHQYRVAPQCTPLATNTLHAVGLAHAATVKGEDTVSLVLLGDGATSEGDTHEALNFAAVFNTPTVFFVQNNGYAISVPLSKQTHAPSLAHKGIGYGMRSVLVDGNDAAAVYAVVSDAITAAARGEGPTLIEAITYRIESHTNADDATRYRDRAEVDEWLAKDPIDRLRAHLTERGLLTPAADAEIAATAEAEAAQLRARMNVDTEHDPRALFRNVYATQTPALRRQEQELLDEIAADQEAQR